MKTSKRIIMIIMSFLLLLQPVLNVSAAPANDDLEEYDEEAELEAFLSEAREALEEITDQNVIMALVYLCDTYKVRTAPGKTGEVCVQVPTGTTVEITGVEIGRAHV